jgi:hypothetical protein
MTSFNISAAVLSSVFGNFFNGAFWCPETGTGKEERNHGLREPKVPDGHGKKI